MLDKKIKRFIYSPSVPIGRAISDLYKKAITICLVCRKDGELLGVLTLSDIKQALLKGVDQKAHISSIMNTSFVSATKSMPLSGLKKLAMKATSFGTGIIDKVPVVDDNKRPVALFSIGQKSARPSTVLLTGGAGYIGSHLSRRLLKEGYRVIVLDKLTFGDGGIRALRKHKNFILVKGDVGDIRTLMKVVPQADYVVHLAGIVGDPAAALNPLQTMEENHFSTKLLIDVCQYYHVSRFVFASSCSVYGVSPSLLSENSRLNPVSLYAQSKLYAERELLRNANNHFHPVILRFGTVYGLSPRMRFDLVANIMTAHAFTKKRITVDGGEQWRPLLHVDDAARACLAMIQAPLEKVQGEIFNVGATKDNFTVASIAKLIAGKCKGVKIEWLNNIKDRRDYRVNFSKIQKCIGFKTAHTVQEGVEEIANAMRRRKFKDWADKKYNNYLTLRNVLETGV
ncbi:MAG: NAD-dependent epimerase/dehydratase [Parcubacteria group bacterium GW2011_GWA1_47_11]|nr:MAG: NAD-dependent epimerase/dehydratase [Parcubacteria group bacterium GW2011_GWA1_47_11]